MKFKFIRKKNLPVLYVCRNCHTHLQGRYCHVCGQDLFAGAKRSVWRFIFGFLESVWSWDGKFWISVRYLLFYPGKLTKEYAEGRVVSYVQPSKLFWFTSILFFILLTSELESLIELDTEKGEIGITDNKSEDKNKNNVVRNETTVVPYILNETLGSINNDMENNNRPRNPTKKKIVVPIDEQTSIEKNKLPPDTVEKKTKKKKNVVESVEEQSKADTDKKSDTSGRDSKKNEDDAQLREFFNYSKGYAPYVMFLLIPFFALLLKLFFRKKERYYVNHLVFAVHFHTFVFFIFGIFMLLYKASPDIKIPVFLYLGIPFVYIVIALYVFYKPRKWTLLIKVFLIGFIYLIIIFIVLILFIVMIYSMISGESLQDIFGN